MAANKFVLKGSGVEVDYTIGANPSFPALQYKHGLFTRASSLVKSLPTTRDLENWSPSRWLRPSMWAVNVSASFFHRLTFAAARLRIFILWASMKSSAGPIPFPVGLRRGVASK